MAIVLYLTAIPATVYLFVLLCRWLTRRRRATAISAEPIDDDIFDNVAEECGAGKTIRLPFERLSWAEMRRRSAQFYADMDRRRSVRHLSSDAVPRAVIDNILLTAGTAPSGAHLQPWTFAVVESAPVKAALRHIVEAEERTNYERRMGADWLADLRNIGFGAQPWRKAYIEHAPYVVVLLKHSYRLDDAGRRQATYYNEIGASIACGLLLAAIQMAGLVTVTTTPMNAGPAIRKLLGRPANEKVLLLLPIGLPVDGARVPDVRRKPLDQFAPFY